MQRFLPSTRCLAQMPGNSQHNDYNCNVHELHGFLLCGIGSEWLRGTVAPLVMSVGQLWSSAGCKRVKGCLRPRENELSSAMVRKTPYSSTSTGVPRVPFTITKNVKQTAAVNQVQTVAWQRTASGRSQTRYQGITVGLNRMSVPSM